MKNSLCGAMVFVCASLIGCADIGTQNAQTPAQIAAQACPAIQATLTTLQLLPGLPADAQANLALAVPVVNAACSVGATVDLSSLQALERTALPIMLDIAKAAALSAADQDRIVAAQIILSTAVAIVDQAHPAKATPAP
jgi:hypothetical protein